MRLYGGELKPEQLQFLIRYQQLANEAKTNNEIKQLEAMKKEFNKILKNNSQKNAEKNLIIRRLEEKYSKMNNSILIIPKLAAIESLLQEIISKNINNSSRNFKLKVLGEIIKKYKNNKSVLTTFNEFKNYEAEYNKIIKAKIQ